MAKKRINTNLESSGAEFLVLGHLLIEGISSYKTYHNFPDYDLVSINPAKNLSLKIQVKSRYSTNWDGFIIKNTDCDFVVFVALNRGFSKAKRNGDNGIKPPEFYIFPIKYVIKNRDPKNKWGKLTKSRMVNFLKYLNQWDLIKNKLKL